MLHTTFLMLLRSSAPTLAYSLHISICCLRGDIHGSTEQRLKCAGSPFMCWCFLKNYFQRHRSDKEFEQFYRKTVQLAEELEIYSTVLP